MASSEQQREETPDSQEYASRLELLNNSISSKLGTEDGNPPPEPHESSYTHLAINEDGLWFCPHCSKTARDKEEKEHLIHIGYGSLVSLKATLISIYTNKHPDLKDIMLFQNPPFATRCHSLDLGSINSIGVRCGFDRKTAEKNRWLDREQAFLVKNKEECLVGWVCTECSVTNRELEKNPERRKYVEQSRNQKSRERSGYEIQVLPWFKASGEGEDEESYYREDEESLQSEEDRIKKHDDENSQQDADEEIQQGQNREEQQDEDKNMQKGEKKRSKKQQVWGCAKHMIFDGTLESLMCDTKKWGQGGDMEEFPCLGQYGKRPYYWRRNENGDWVQDAWIAWTFPESSSSGSDFAG